MNKNIRIFFIVILVVLLAIIIINNSKIICFLKGGFWDKQHKVCNFYTKDGGERCVYGANCEARICLYDSVNKIGYCPYTREIFGCFLTYNHGYIEEICFD